MIDRRGRACVPVDMHACRGAVLASGLLEEQRHDAHCDGFSMGIAGGEVGRGRAYICMYVRAPV